MSSDTIDPWPQWVEKRKEALDTRSFGHELYFVQHILRHIPEIDPTWVTHEYPFTDSRGKNRRVDFVLQHHSLDRAIAIEVDGKNKTGRRPTHAEHDDWLLRQNAITRLGMRLSRFSNSQIAHNPMEVRKEIRQAVAEEQIAAKLRAPQPAAASSPPPNPDPVPQPAAASSPPPNPDPVPQPAAASSQAGRPVVAALAAIVLGVVAFAYMGGSSEPDAKPAVAAEEPAPPVVEELGVEPPERFACPSSHPVKGNESSRSEEFIYHVPGGRFYDQTNPVRCFASTEEATQAGFRASQQ